MTEQEFKDLVFSFTDYTKEMLTEFFDYWSEPNKKGKMRWELEKTWDVSRRLKRWFDNQKKWNANKYTNTGSGKVLTEANKGDFGRL